MSLAQYLNDRKNETIAFNESLERMNSLFNSSVAAFEQKIKLLEGKVASLEQTIAVSPHEDPLKKIHQNRVVANENLQNLRTSLLSELKEFLSRRPIIE